MLAPAVLDRFQVPAKYLKIRGRRILAASWAIEDRESTDVENNSPVLGKRQRMRIAPG
jgi:hypothetical protein